MMTHAAGVLSAIASRLPATPGRRQRRHWTGDGRAHIEVKGLHRPEAHPLTRHVEAALSDLDGVEWAQVNAVTGRVIVAFDDGQVNLDDLVDVIDGVEEAHGLADERFPHDHPDHPADAEPIQRQVYAIGADIGSLVLGGAGRIAFGQFGRLARRNPLVGEVASVLALIESAPVLRRALEERLGRAATDLGLAASSALAQALSQGPLGMVTDIAHRALLLDELRARRQEWARWEPLLYAAPPGQPPAAAGDTGDVADREIGEAAVSARTPRPIPLPAGPVETYSNRAAAGALLGAAATLAATRDPHLMVAATAAANPKPAKLGREGFAARLGRDLARSGVLAMDAESLRRLDRVDAVVLDTQVLTTGRLVAGSVWVAPEHQARAEEAVVAAHALLAGRSAPGSRERTPAPGRSRDPAPDPAPHPAAALAVPRARAAAEPPPGEYPLGQGGGAQPAARAAAMAAHPSAFRRQGPGSAPASARAPTARQVAGAPGGAPDGQAGWAIGPAPRGLAGLAREAAAAMRARGARIAGLFRDGDLAGLVAVEPELDPLAIPLLTTARSAGLVVAAGRGGLGARAPVDRVVAGGSTLAGSVRALQAEGRVVALVSARQHAALAAADVGIGVRGGAERRPGRTTPRAPWGADLVTGADLADACRILQAIPPARAASRRAAVLAAYGSGAGAVLAVAGPRPGAAARSLLAVNGAALASLASGVWSAMTLARRPPPLPAETTGWHALDTAAVLARLDTAAAGLSAEEAARRRAARGAGTQAGPRAPAAEPGLVRASAEELANPLTPVLATGAGLAAVAGSLTDAALIGTFMAANALVSGAQRVSVGHALRRLIDESAVRVRLRRGRQTELGTAEQLVPGDVIVVQAGDAVPADCRILTARGLEVDESSLTGESQLVPKSAAATGAVNLAERRSMLYAGSSVAAGEAAAVVVATGQATELGRSAQAGTQERRPGGVQARLRELTRLTVPVTLGAGAALIGGGLLRGQALRDTLGTGVGLAVAAVPEGLPIVATAAQYSAARRLSRRNALVRNPGTIEALGRVDVLCFDKTGTLTEGRIALHRVLAGPAGLARPLAGLRRGERLVLAAGLRASPERRDGEALAHATDHAVVDGARQAGVGAGLGADGWRQVGELPFEPSRGYHAVLGRTTAGQLLCVKGAPEVVLPLCTRQRRGQGTADLDRRARNAIARAADQLARRGYRVLAVAERDASSRRDLREDRITRLRFAGLLALTDPVRETAAEAISGLRAAGVAVLMLTGDHPSTAEAIAAELGLLDGGRVVTGAELDDLADTGLDALVGRAAVFARVSPDHKVRIVESLRRTGRVVAVTGDGANDAPAIRLADVGVALGRRGTNAAKDAADIVVTDDRIETIIDAIVEGRAMWSSVRDAIAMLLGGNLGEIAFTLGTGLLRPGGSVLNARQLLLVNLLTDMVPSLALAVKQPEGATPQSLLSEGPDASLGAALNRDIVIRGSLTAGAALAAWAGGRMTGVTPRRASTTALVGLVGAQLGQTLVTGWRSPLVVAASVGSAAALAGVIQTPAVSQFFGCTPLGPVGWTIGLGAAGAASLGAPLVSRLPGPASAAGRGATASARAAGTPPAASP